VAQQVFQLIDETCCIKHHGKECWIGSGPVQIAIVSLLVHGAKDDLLSKAGRKADNKLDLKADPIPTFQSISLPTSPALSKAIVESIP